MTIEEYLAGVNDYLPMLFGSELSTEGEEIAIGWAEEYTAREVLAALKIASEQYYDVLAYLSMIPRILANRATARRMIRTEDERG